MQKSPTVFLSYSWKNQKEAETIYSDLVQVGINLTKDNHDLKYKDSLNEFMESIRNADFALVLISDDYLKSKNCMYETIQLFKDQNAKNKLLPIILKNSKIFKANDRLKYIRYWEKQKTRLTNYLKKVDAVNALSIYADLKIINEIVAHVDGFLKEIKDLNTISLENLKLKNYTPVLTTIGYEDISWATDLLSIINLKSMINKEIALDEYLTKHPPNTHYYAIKGGICSKLGKKEQAKFNYLQSIKLDKENTEALNNLGQLYENVFNEFDNAKDCYNEAILYQPKSTIPRLNLGHILTTKFNDEEGAKIQYEKILSYDPNEPKAHNNLANYYRGKKDEIDYTENILFHLNKAIEIKPDYIEPYLLLGNFLKQKGDKESGNKIYRIAKTFTKEKDYIQIIDALLESNF